MKKRFGTLALALIMACSLAIPAGAVVITDAMDEHILYSSFEGRNVLSDGTLVEDDAIVLRNAEDVEAMIKRDEATYAQEYAKKVRKIDSQLKRDFEEFTAENGAGDAATYDEVIDEFVAMYPEYADVNIEEDIVTLQDNVTADLVRDFFRGKGYTISLALFNHSLTENPEKAYLDIIGNTAGIYYDVRKQLTTEYDFFSKMVTFSRAASSYKTETVKTYVFDKVNTDMYWAIHKFDWKRTRTAYDKAYFKIIDTYDFASGPSITGVVASMAGTHDFPVEIYGLVQNGVLK